ncbi:Cupin domain protein [Streptomyces sp. YIM 130001]|uniref:cupin domain-containing protein n=1 Tax=Streptomyces sp. YIM 130001 TaxID=2259644 RepID=UPI000ECB4258|nr:cupin domain-containing protein [Streptomyces sp. YIM 130001]RII16094.1 Cupin domain protein [Streptomyces sp. YIM 130001]
MAGGELTEGVQLTRPMAEEDIADLDTYTVEQMRRRVVTQADLEWSDRAFLGGALPGGRAELALVVGYGMTEDRRQEPRVHRPHGHNIAWLRAEQGEGVLSHRHRHTQVLMAKDGEWEVTLNQADQRQTVRLGERDMLSVPAGAWRSMRNVADTTATMIVVNSGDGRVRMEWDEEVVKASADAGVGVDHDGYLAPLHLLPSRPGR